MVKYGGNTERIGIYMENQFKHTKNALIVYLCGEVDQYAAAEMRDKIDLEIENMMRKNLIFELSEVTLMDSSGIGLIVGRYKLINSLGGKVILCGATESIEKMIALSGILKIVTVCKNLTDAKKCLEGKEG